MRRKLLLPALAACSMLAISAPVATAKAHKASIASSLSKVSGAVKGLQKAVKNIQDINTGQTSAINGVDKRVDTVVATVSAITAGVPAIVSGLTALKDGLLAVNAALTDSTTGLVGLNLARPQFGAFTVNGTLLGGTGQTAGASGPRANATQGRSVTPAAGGADMDGLFVVEFDNDVSKRVLSVNVFPYGPTALGGAGTAPTASAAGCSANASVAALCGLVGAGPSDSSQNHVLVQIGDAKSGGATNGFSVSAISG